MNLKCPSGEVNVEPAQRQDVTPYKQVVRISKIGQDCEVSIRISAAGECDARPVYRDRFGFAPCDVLIERA